MPIKYATKVIPIKYRGLIHDLDFEEEDFEGTVLDPEVTHIRVLPSKFVFCNNYKFLFLDEEERVYALKIPAFAKILDRVNGLILIDSFTRYLDTVVAGYFSSMNASRFRDGTFNVKWHIENLQTRLYMKFRELFIKFIDHPDAKSFSAVVIPWMDAPDASSIEISVNLWKRLGKSEHGLVWRNPIHDTNSMRAVKIYTNPKLKNVIRVPIAMWIAMKGDFDGDTISGIMITKTEFNKAFKQFENIFVIPEGLMPDIESIEIEKKYSPKDIIAIEQHKQKYTASIVGLGLRLEAYAQVIGLDKYVGNIATDIVSNLGQLALDIGHKGGVRTGRGIKAIELETIDEFVQLFVDKPSIDNPKSLIEKFEFSEGTVEVINRFLEAKEDSLYDIIDIKYPLYSLIRGRIKQIKDNDEFIIKENRLYDDVFIHIINLNMIGGKDAKQDTDSKDEK